MAALDDSMADQVISGSGLNQIQQILGPDAAYAQTCVAQAEKYGVEPAALAEAVKETREQPQNLDNDFKLKNLVALNNVPLLMQTIAMEMAAQDRQAIEIMGGPALDVSAPIPPNFTRPDFIHTTPPNLPVQDNNIYATCAHYIGKKYVWGGKDLESAGVDCSGYVRGIFKKLGYELPFSSQDQANAVAKMTGEKAVSTSCKNVTAAQIPDNAVMTMGPKNGIGHVVIVTTNNKGERVVMQSMGGGVGVCEMPLSKFVDYLHRQPAGRALTIANSGPLVENKLKANLSTQPSDPRGQRVEPIKVAPKNTGRIDLAHSTPMPPVHLTTPQPASQPTLGASG